MGYGYYELPTPEGIMMRRGYSVQCICYKRDCHTKIDRGLAYLCYHCTRYFCYEHLVVSGIEADCFAGKSVQVCEKCAKEIRRLTADDNVYEGADY